MNGLLELLEMGKESWEAGFIGTMLIALAKVVQWYLKNKKTQKDDVQFCRITSKVEHLRSKMISWKQTRVRSISIDTERDAMNVEIDLFVDNILNQNRVNLSKFKSNIAILRYFTETYQTFSHYFMAHLKTTDRYTQVFFFPAQSYICEYFISSMQIVCESEVDPDEAVCMILELIETKFDLIISLYERTE